MAHLTLRNVSLSFPIYHGGARSLKRAVLAAAMPGNLKARDHGRVTVSALKDINLDLRAGDRLALIGANGGGKTSLLKLMGGIYVPQEGVVETEGNLRILLSTTLGMSVNATGWENILLMGLHMKIRPAEMRGHYAEIAKWSALGTYLDAPVRTYSAGMLARLAFATATCFSPDILLLDEWLGVGDRDFQANAQERLKSFVGGTSIVVLASHSLPLVEAWCNKAILLENGRITAQGSVAEIRARYENAQIR